MRSILISNYLKKAEQVYPAETREYLKENAGLDDRIYTKDAVMADPSAFHNVDYLFSTWGMPAMTEEEIQAAFPNVKCLFYSAGTVQTFARPFLNCGIRVFSAWAANAVPVAEYTVAQIILANTGYFHTSVPATKGDGTGARQIREQFPGNYNVNVGIIGVGMIGGLVIDMLKNYKLNVFAYSPSLTEEKAARLGVKRATIEEIFANCQVVSNHLANLPQTVGILKKEHFASMLPYSTFLNTGRGAQVVEADLIEALRQRPDIMAVLDVTDPEPPLESSEFYALPNCILTPHIAGSIGQEVHRMSEYMVAQFNNVVRNLPTQYEVDCNLLERMA